MIYPNCTAVLEDGRLLVAVTRFDEFYYAIDDEQGLSEDEIGSKVCASVTKATGGGVLSKENVIPICGLWAYIAGKLACDPTNEDLQKKARRCLKYYGEAQAGDDALSGHELAKKLAETSGVSRIEEK